jgi:HPt (histidine-containing phosphotransfer) domain-containing protein
MDDYLGKPVKLEDLAATLARWTATLTPVRAMPASDSMHAQTRGLNPKVLAELHRLENGLVDELIRSYLLDLDGYLSAMRAALANRNYSHVAQITHALKGASASIGATEMTRLCAELERMAAQAATQDVDALMTQVEVESRRLRGADQREELG